MAVPEEAVRRVVVNNGVNGELVAAFGIDILGGVLVALPFTATPRGLPLGLPVLPLPLVLVALRLTAVPSLVPLIHRVDEADGVVVGVGALVGRRLVRPLTDATAAPLVPLQPAPHRSLAPSVIRTAGTAVRPSGVRLDQTPPHADRPLRDVEDAEGGTIADPRVRGS